MTMSSVLPAKAQTCFISFFLFNLFFIFFPQNGEYLFHKNLIEIVAILPDPTLFCISENLPADFNYNWLKVEIMYSGKKQNKSVWKLSKMARISDQKRGTL